MIFLNFEEMRFLNGRRFCKEKAFFSLFIVLTVLRINGLINEKIGFNRKIGNRASFIDFLYLVL